MNQTYPLHTQIGIFENEDELRKWVMSCDENILPIDYGYLIKCPTYFNTPKIADILDRYYMHKTFGITSYGNDYDKMPSYLIDGFEVIESQIPKIEKFLGERQKKAAKNG